MIKRKTSATTLFCAIADPVVLNPPTSNRKRDTIRAAATVFQDLRPMPDSSLTNREVSSTLSASQFLWKLSEKWTRMDTNPDPLPLPQRLAPEGRMSQGHMPTTSGQGTDQTHNSQTAK
ncbi:unnamed protein product [Echinostoma caproni]|uniref:Uncharacterized protein n=1 Tax=Echinostoma caproni TaxID=27848 RepID=A0A3P8LDU9_9TREM|nr:unnamed protein product [Echinostoma caproni]